MLKKHSTARPVNLNLFTIKFPIPAVVSILHRITGVILLLSMLFWLWILLHSVASAHDFEQLQILLHMPWMRAYIWLLVLAVIYHLLCGIRHMLIELHIGEGKMGGRYSAWLVCLATLLLSVAWGLRVLW